jgi:alanine racemase
MRNTSVIELSKEALCNNLRFLKNRVGDERVYSSVVKGNAYGHGQENPKCQITIQKRKLLHL